MLINQILFFDGLSREQALGRLTTGCSYHHWRVVSQTGCVVKLPGNMVQASKEGPHPQGHISLAHSHLFCLHW